MASRNLFTEEGRTRLRNFGLRLRSYLIVFLILGLLAGAFWFSNRTRVEMGALERLYFRQYAKATAMSWISPARPGKYTLLTSGAIGVTDELVYQVRDEQGRPARNQYGWVFKPQAGVRIEEPRWRLVRTAHGTMESWLRKNIYGGESLPGLFAPAIAVCLLITTAGTAIALAIDQRVNRTYEQGNRLRGNRLVEPAEYAKEVKGADGLGLVVKSTKPERAVEKLKRAAARRAEPTWALRMKRSEEAQGAMILGDIGAGKSQIIHRLFRQIAERNNEAAVVYDPACEFVKAHYNERRGDVILNPLDERSPFWSPAFETRFRTDYQVLAEAFFPGRKADKMQQSEQFFLNASRDIFARMLEFDPSPTQLVAWLADEEEIDRMCEGTELANYIRADAAPQRAVVLGSLARVGKTLRILPRSEECDFDCSLTDWATERRGWIFLTSTKEAEERLRPLYTSYLDLLMRRLMSVDDAWGKTRPVKLIVDEVHTLQYLPSLYAAATEGRKYGLHLFQGAQNKHQYEDNYGKQAPTMLSCPRYKVILRCKEPDSAKWLSTLLGEEELDRPRMSVTASVSDQGRDSVNYASQIERRPVVSISLQGRSGNGRERGGRAPDGAEVGRDQLAGSTEALKPVRYYEAQGFTPINPASGSHLGSGLAEQGFRNENTIQRRDATTEALMTALQTIANIEAPDPSGRRSLKELSATADRIALAALAGAGGAEAVRDKEEGAALGKIAGIMASDQQGRLLNLQERIDDAVKIARATIGEIESRMLAQSVMVNAAEMAQPRQPSTPGHGIGW